MIVPIFAHPIIFKLPRDYIYRESKIIGSTDDSFLQALVDFLKLMLTGAFDQEISSIIFGDN